MRPSAPGSAPSVLCGAGGARATAVVVLFRSGPGTAGKRIATGEVAFRTVKPCGRRVAHHPRTGRRELIRARPSLVTWGGSGPAATAPGGVPGGRERTDGEGCV